MKTSLGILCWRWMHFTSFSTATRLRLRHRTRI